MKPEFLFLAFLIVFVFLWWKGLPQLVRRYSDRKIFGATHVGYYWFWPLRHYRLSGAVRFRSMGAICRVSANPEGMIIQPVFLPWPGGAHILWSDVWIDEVSSIFGMSTRIGFLSGPDVSFRLTSAFQRHVERAIKGPIPL